MSSTDSIPESVEITTGEPDLSEDDQAAYRDNCVPTFEVLKEILGDLHHWTRVSNFGGNKTTALIESVPVTMAVDWATPLFNWPCQYETHVGGEKKRCGGAFALTLYPYNQDEPASDIKELFGIHLEGDHASLKRGGFRCNWSDEETSTYREKMLGYMFGKIDPNRAMWAMVKLKRAIGGGETKWIIPNILEEGMMAALFGPPKVGKSLFALECALKLVSDGKVVLYLDEENNLEEVYERALAMGYDLADESMQDLRYRSFTDWCVDADGQEEESEELTDAAAILAAAQGCDLVIFDSWAKFFKHGSQNDDAAINRAYSTTLKPLRKKGIAVLRLDHTGHGNFERPAGSVQKIADVDHNWGISKDERDGVTKISLTHYENRTNRGPDAIVYKRVTSPSLAHVPYAPAAREVEGETDQERTESLAREMGQLKIDPNMSLDQITDILKANGVATTRRATVSAARRLYRDRMDG